MSNVQIATAILELISGIGIFMIACTRVSSNLEAVSSDKLKQLLSKVSNNKLVGILTGAATTAIIQSSGATVVMTIGFVDAGIMTLTQAANIIYGAEVGTTITGQIVALGMFGGGESLSMNVLFGALAGVGVILEMSLKHDKQKTIAKVISGLGMLFVGLNLMSTSMNQFAQLESIKVLLASINSIIVLVIAGAVITAIVQSSSAMTSVAIAMVVAGLITIDQGIYITLGANIGSCITGFIAGLTGGINARRTSLIQTIFNIAGVILFLIINRILIIVTGGSFSCGALLADAFPGMPQTQLAMFHTFFNVASVILVIPVGKALVDLSVKLIPDQEEKINPNEPHFMFVNNFMLKTPAIAVKQTQAELVNMGELAMANYNQAIDSIINLKLDNQEVFDDNEKQLDFLNINLSHFVSKLSSLKIDKKDRNFLANAYHVIIDFERIGDYSVNLTEYKDSLKAIGEKLTPDAVKEVEQLKDLVNSLYTATMIAYTNEDKADLAQVEAIEQEIDDFTRLMEENHLKRSNKNQCSAQVGALYQSMASDSERVGDHLMNIANTIKDY